MPHPYLQRCSQPPRTNVVFGTIVDEVRQPGGNDHIEPPAQDRSYTLCSTAQRRGRNLCSRAPGQRTPREVEGESIDAGESDEALGSGLGSMADGASDGEGEHRKCLHGGAEQEGLARTPVVGQRKHDHAAGELAACGNHICDERVLDARDGVEVGREAEHYVVSI
jgi:hypothetical protein